MLRQMSSRLRRTLIFSPLLALGATLVLAATTFAATGGADWPLF
jgi:hypothetical protein